MQNDNCIERTRVVGSSVGKTRKRRLLHHKQVPVLGGMHSSERFKHLNLLLCICIFFAIVWQHVKDKRRREKHYVVKPVFLNDLSVTASAGIEQEVEN